MRAALLVGCKYDKLLSAPPREHALVCRAAQEFAYAINAPLAFCAPSLNVNVSNIFKVILIRLFGLAHKVPQHYQPGEPLLIYEGQLLLKVVDKRNRKVKVAGAQIFRRLDKYISRYTHVQKHGAPGYTATLG